MNNNSSSFRIELSRSLFLSKDDTLNFEIRLHAHSMISTIDRILRRLQEDRTTQWPTKLLLNRHVI